MVRNRKGEKPTKGSSKNDRASSQAEESTAEHDIPSILDDGTASLFTFGLLFGIYVGCLHPSVPGGDSGELIISAHELGVAHPPGYPLFTMLAKLVMTVFPFGSVAWRVNILNAVFASLAGTFLQLTVLKLTSDIGVSYVAVGFFCLNRLTWFYSVGAEVFALNNLLIAVMMYLTVQFEKAVRESTRAGSDISVALRYANFGAFVCGLALCNQHTAVIYVAVIAVWVLYSLRKIGCLDIKQLLLLGVCFSLGLTPYAYLPVSSYMNTARWTWGDQTSWSGFLKHLLRSEYGTFQLGKDREGVGFLAGFEAYLYHGYVNLGRIGPILAVVGAVASVGDCYRNRVGESSLFVFIVMLSSYTTFFAWRANLDVSDALMRGVVERFWMQSDIIVVILAAVGTHTLAKLVARFYKDKERAVLFSITSIAGLVVMGINFQNIVVSSQRSNLVVHDFARTMLNKMPQNAIILTKGDLPANTLRYFYLCEKVRPDLTLIDVEVLTYEWALPMLEKFYDRVTFPGDKWHKISRLWPDGSTSFTMKMFLDSNYNKGEIYACIGMTEKDLSWQSDYTLWPFGPCQRVVKRTEPFSVKRWVEKTKDYTADWKYPYDAFDAKSWEKVANDEMWGAKINLAFHLYAESQNTKDGQTKAEMLLASHELYLKALQENQGKNLVHTDKPAFPAYWHKNFALVCDRLLHVESHLPKVNLAQHSIYHFEQYVMASPDDPEVPSIVEAIRALSERIDTYHKLDSIERTFSKKIT